MPTYYQQLALTALLYGSPTYSPKTANHTYGSLCRTRDPCVPVDEGNILVSPAEQGSSDLASRLEHSDRRHAAELPGRDGQAEVRTACHSDMSP